MMKKRFVIPKEYIPTSLDIAALWTVCLLDNIRPGHAYMNTVSILVIVLNWILFFVERYRDQDMRAEVSITESRSQNA